MKVSRRLMRSCGFYVNQAVVSVAHGSVETFIRRDEAVKSRMFTAFAASMVGYGERLCVLFVSWSMSVDLSCLIREKERRESRRELREEERSGWALLGRGSSSWSTVEILGDDTGSLIGGDEF